METIQTFVLGAVSALGIIYLGYAFIQALKINKTIKTLQKEIEGMQREFDETHPMINETFSETHDQIYRRIDELNRYVDSRLDKQADKTGNVISLVSKDSLKNKEKIEKLEELFKLQMDQFAKVTLNHSERLADLETYKKTEEDRIDQINS
jgi:uncharacterized membrane-anchored protein YhcB (DUF1043 family)